MSLHTTGWIIPDSADGIVLVSGTQHFPYKVLLWSTHASNAMVRSMAGQMAVLKLVLMLPVAADRGGAADADAES